MLNNVGNFGEANSRLKHEDEREIANASAAMLADESKKWRED